MLVLTTPPTLYGDAGDIGEPYILRGDGDKYARQYGEHICVLHAMLPQSSRNPADGALCAI